VRPFIYRVFLPLLGVLLNLNRPHRPAAAGHKTGKPTRTPHSFVSDSPPVPPLVALAVAIVAISTGAILVRLSEAPSAVAAFYRVLFTTLPLLPIAVWQHRSAFGRLGGRDLLGATLAGVALAIHFAAWFESLEWTSVAASVTLVQSQPLFVALGAWLLLRERLTRRMLAGIVVAVAGMATMSMGDLLGGVLVGPDPVLGNGLAVLGAVMAAGYVLAGRSLRQRVALVPYVVVVYSVCTVCLLVIALLQGGPLLAYPAREWLIFAGLAVGPGLLGHTVINWTLAHLESSVVSVSLLGEPIGATILAVAFLSESPTAFTVAGGVVVLAGIYVTAADRRRATATDTGDGTPAGTGPERPADRDEPD
jgi:drug/metabolite transporter (DMT)-like permease